jgi:hypothetical protein
MPAISGLMVALTADLAHWLASRIPLALLLLCSIAAATLTKETATTVTTTTTIASTAAMVSPTS